MHTTTPAPRADGLIAQNWASYSAAEHATWKTLYERQARMLPGRACEAFRQGLRDLPQPQWLEVLAVRPWQGHEIRTRGRAQEARLQGLPHQAARRGQALEGMR